MSQLNKKFNTNIPATRLGIRSIRSSFNAVELTIEAKKFLADLNGSLHVIYDPNRDAPDLRIMSSSNKMLGTLAELENLAKYKAIIGKKIDDQKQENEKDEFTVLIRNLRSEYGVNNHGATSPDRILEANNQRLMKLLKEHEALEKNAKVIESLPISPEKGYLSEKIRVMKKIQITIMSACMGAEKVETDFYNNVLTALGIPKWIEGKLIDKAFTKDAKLDAKPLLFSKGNFMKSVSLTTAELRNAEFCSANEFLLRGSKVIHELANSTRLADFLTRGMSGTTDEVEAEYLKLNWPMVGRDTVEELLEPRINRHRVTGFSEYLAPKPKPGQNDFRPETTQKKETRLLKNKLGQILNVYLNLFHFIPLVDDPISDFWSLFFPNAGAWVITPESQIYNWINDEGNKTAVLGNIRNLSTNRVKEIARKMVLMKLEIPAGRPRATELGDILDGLGPNEPDLAHGGHNTILATEAMLVAAKMDELKTHTGTLTDELRQEVDLFRGKVTSDTLKASKEERDYVGSGNLVSTRAKKILSRIDDKDLKKSIFEWVRDNFSGERFQILAARKAAAAVEDKGLGYNTLLEEQDEDSASESDDSW